MIETEERQVEGYQLAFRNAEGMNKENTYMHTDRVRRKQACSNPIPGTSQMALNKGSVVRKPAEPSHSKALAKTADVIFEGCIHSATAAATAAFDRLSSRYYAVASFTLSDYRRCPFIKK